ncbi:hypothetical protein FXO38_01039 [Capsicum annuum]|nr:hypothetical protein FXO38_01039 [Capsicum annuum]
MGAMVRGDLVPWCAVPWCLGTMMRGALVLWCAMPWYAGAMVPWCVVPWCHGVCHGTRYHGALAPWCHGVRCRGALVPWIMVHGAVVPWCNQLDKDTTMKSHCMNIRWDHCNDLFSLNTRISLVHTSSELAVRRTEKAPEGTVPSPSPDRPVVTHSRRRSSFSSPLTADGFRTGTLVPILQSQFFFQSYRSILPTTLAYIIPSTRGCLPWRPDAVTKFPLALPRSGIVYHISGPDRGLGPGSPLRTLLQTIIQTIEMLDSKAALFSFCSLLLRESLIHGCHGARCLGAIVPWYLGAWCLGTMLRGAMVHGALVLWCAVPWCHGTQYLGTMVPWRRGAIVPWCHEALVPWRHGTLVPWRYGSRYHGALVIPTRQRHHHGSHASPNQKYDMPVSCYCLRLCYDAVHAMLLYQ